LRRLSRFGPNGSARCVYAAGCRLAQWRHLLLDWWSWAEGGQTACQSARRFATGRSTWDEGIRRRRRRCRTVADNELLCARATEALVGQAWYEISW